MRKRSTLKDGKAFIDAAFRDRVSWVAARLILANVLEQGLTDENRARIERFLANHPAPKYGSKDGSEGTGLSPEGS